MKYKIVGIENFDNVHRYIINKDRDIHKIFCNLLSDLKFDENSIIKVDIIFDNLDNDFIYVNNDEFEIYFFITTDYVNLVVKSDIKQKELNEIIGKYFSFPK